MDADGEAADDDVRKQAAGKQTSSSEDLSSSSASPPPPRVLARRRRAIATCSSKSMSKSSSDDTSAVADSHRRQRRGGISVERGPDQQTTYVTVTGESLAVRLESKLERLLSQVEYGSGSLVGSTDSGTCAIASRRLDRFLMQHRRQKKRPLKDVPSDEELALLDFAYYQQALKVLSRVGQWNFNTFLLDSMTGGRSLPTLLIHLFQYYNLIEFFRLDIVKLWKCFVMIEEGYHSNNPYHNAVHATDVTQAMHCFLQEAKIRENITPMEVMTSLLAAVSHDVDHPGVNQPFLVATSNHLAALYKNSSVLENHHWRSAMCCLFQSGVLDHLDAAQWEDLRHQIRSLILATDITRQPEFLCILRHYLETNYLDLKDEHNRHFVLQIALKCADICNPCRPWEISTRWSRKVCEEFFLQGDTERELGLPVTALCDRNSTTVAKIQSGFFRFVVAPLFEEWNRFLQTPLSSTLITNLRQNQEKWAALEVEDANRDVQEKIAEEITSVESERPTGILLSLPSDTVEKIGLFGRRHSVPVNLPKTMSRICARFEGPHQFRAPFLASSSLTSPVEEESSILSPSTSSSLTAQPARGLLVKQSTFPPIKPSARFLHRQSAASTMRPSVAAQELLPKARSSSSSSSSNSGSGECRGDGKCCSNNGCGTPQSPLVNTEDQAFKLTADVSDAHNDWGSSHGLVRLKSDSDLLEHNIKALNGKNGGGHRRAKEKENEDPISRAGSTLPPWKGRKGKNHGVSVGYRLTNRRASAPVGLLLEDVAKGLARSLVEETAEKSRRRDFAPILLLGDQPPRNGVHVPSVGNKRSPSRFYRRASLPTVLTFNTAVNTFADFISIGLKRRSSVPADELFGLSASTRNSSLSELFPMPRRSGSSNGVDAASFSAILHHPAVELPNGLVNSVRSAHLLRQTQSFDAAFMGDMAHLMAAVTVKMPEQQQQQVPNIEFRHSVQNSMFSSRRRGSLPVEACLFTLSSDERTANVMVDVKCENAMQS